MRIHEYTLTLARKEVDIGRQKGFEKGGRSSHLLEVPT